MAPSGLLLISSSSSLWLAPVVTLCVAGLILITRRSVGIAEKLCLVVALVAAIQITGANDALRYRLTAGGSPATINLPTSWLGAPATWSLSAPSVTILIFVLLSFLFSLSWLVAARPRNKSLFWLVLQFACIWGLSTAADLSTIFICAQLLMVSQYFLNLGAGAAHSRRIARRMLFSSIVSNACILAAVIFFQLPMSGHLAMADEAASRTAFVFIMASIWISLSLFPFHNVQNARMTIDGQNLLPLNSNLWVGLALMLWMERSPLAGQLHHATLWLALLGIIAMAACSVACFAQRELSRSMAYAAGTISAFAYLAWLAQNRLGVVGAVLILGVLPVTVFGFQRGIDLLFLQARDITVSPDDRTNSRGAVHLLFLLLTAACVGMPATAVFRGVWLALVGMILTTTQAGDINWQTFFLGFIFLLALMPMILGVVSRSLLAFRDPAQNVRRPDINVYAGNAGLGPDTHFIGPLKLDAYVRTARRWAIGAMLVSLTLGIFPTLAMGSLLKSFNPRVEPHVTPPRLSVPPIVLPPNVIVERIVLQRRVTSLGRSYR